MSAINGKVNALIAKMTVQEKFGQLTMAGPDGANGAPGPKLLAGAKNGTIGTVLDLVGVDNINQAQQAALQSRLKIPLIFGLDVIHGYKTMFPVPIGEASTWDPATVKRPCRRPRPPPTGSSGRSTRWSTSAATRAGDAW
jgi:beta-glucosidase